MKRSIPSAAPVPLLAALLLSACAAPAAQQAGLRPALTTEKAASAAAAAAQDAPASPGGLFLAGAVALNAGSGATAADMFDRASLADPNDFALKERAFTSNLLAGRVERAGRFAPAPGESGEGLVALGRLTRAVDALADGRGKEADALLAEGRIGPPHTAAAALLQPWAALAAGDSKRPSAPHPGSDRVVLAFADLGRARLAERAGKPTVAEPLYKALSAQRDSIFTQAYGGFLERRDRRAEAVKLYDAALQRTPDDIPLQRARARAAAGKPAPAQVSLREGAAESLVGPAASLSLRREGDRGLSYLRLALRLDPSEAPIWMLVGDAMDSAGDVDGAAAAYRSIKPEQAEYVPALTRLALLRQKANDSEGALALAAQAYAAAPTDPQAMVTYAELLRIGKRYDAAIAVLDKLLAKTGKSRAAAKVYYLRAAAQERAGRWPEAEADLKRSLAIDPDDAEVQNYLGYGWADRGEHLPEAIALLKKAVAASPGQGALLDSLGWARLHAGDVKGAVADLERAAALEPADAAIVDHLGDAYWRIGRQTEARYQWNRVLTLDPEDEVRARVEVKLKDGGPVTALASSTPTTAAR
jgi:tetratricopeptide (TPR) repeat protein